MSMPARLNEERYRAVDREQELTARVDAAWEALAEPEKRTRIEEAKQELRLAPCRGGGE